MSDKSDFEVPSSDHTASTEFEKYAHRLIVSGSDIPRPHAHDAFFAGWNARFHSAVSRFGGSSDEGNEAITIIQNHVRVVTGALRTVQDEYFDMYRSYLAQKRNVERLREALRVKRDGSDEENAWVRVSNQRKELKALGKHISELRATIFNHVKRREEQTALISEQAGRLAELEAQVLSNVVRNDTQLTWKQLAESYHHDLKSANRFQKILFDLDRNSNGRHEGDADGYDPTGISQGNPHLPPGHIIGYDISGRAYVRPDRNEEHKPEAWIAQ